jgi:hypothetical protein
MNSKQQPDFSQFESYIRDSFHRRGLPVDRCSQILFSQLAHMPNRRVMNYPFQFVEREIQHLEGQGKNSNEASFALQQEGARRKALCIGISACRAMSISA